MAECAARTPNDHHKKHKLNYGRDFYDRILALNTLTRCRRHHHHHHRGRWFEMKQEYVFFGQNIIIIALSHFS